MSGAPEEANDVGSPLSGIDHLIGQLELLFATAALATTILVATWNFVQRIFTGQETLWWSEWVSASVFAIGILGAALAARHERLIAMDFASRFLGPRKRAWNRQLIRVFVVIVCTIGAIHAIGVAQTPAGAGEGGLLHNILWLLPIGFILVAIHMAIHFLDDLIILVQGNLPPEPQQGAH